MREEYVPPVGFAKEPSEERKRWIGRILLGLLLAFIVWLFVTRVINPPEEIQRLPTPQESQLPGPV